MVPFRQLISTIENLGPHKAGENCQNIMTIFYQQLGYHYSVCLSSQPLQEKIQIRKSIQFSSGNTDLIETDPHQQRQQATWSEGAQTQSA